MHVLCSCESRVYAGIRCLLPLSVSSVYLDSVLTLGVFYPCVFSVAVYLESVLTLGVFYPCLFSLPVYLGCVLGLGFFFPCFLLLCI